MSMLQLFSDNLLPVFLIAGTGWLLTARMRLDPRAVAQVSLNVLAPALMFDLIMQNRLPPADLARMMGYGFACLLVPAALAFALARWQGWSRSITSAVVLAVMLTNSGNYGLSVTVLALGQRGLAQASLFFLASSIVSYTGGVFVASLGRTNVRSALVALLCTPTVWSVLLAFVLSGLRVQLPGPVANAAHMLAAVVRAGVPAGAGHAAPWRAAARPVAPHGGRHGDPPGRRHRRGAGVRAAVRAGRQCRGRRASCSRACRPRWSRRCWRASTTSSPRSWSRWRWSPRCSAPSR
jgi:hypothetical protein